MMGIKKIESIGQTPDIELHEAVSALPVTDESQKGKIILYYTQKTRHFYFWNFTTF